MIGFCALAAGEYVRCLSWPPRTVEIHHAKAISFLPIGPQEQLFFIRVISATARVDLHYGSVGRVGEVHASRFMR